MLCGGSFSASSIDGDGLVWLGCTVNCELLEIPSRQAPFGSNWNVAGLPIFSAPGVFSIGGFFLVCTVRIATTTCEYVKLGYLLRSGLLCLDSAID